MEDDQCNAKINHQSCYIDQCCDERSGGCGRVHTQPFEDKGSIEPVIVPQSTIPRSDRKRSGHEHPVLSIEV